MNEIKVLVVDDSAFMRQVISDIINQDDSLTVIGTARNGQDALEKIPILKPHVVTLDVEMPVMDGITTLEHIMKVNPIPVVMLSSLTREGAEATLKALDRGAVDFIPKPAGLKIHSVADELRTKLKVAAKIKIDGRIIRTYSNKRVASQKAEIKTTGDCKLNSKLDKIVVLGTSTGGPKALQEVLPTLPEGLLAPVLIVQHMPRGFTKSLADRLNNLSEIYVKEAEHGEILKAGVAYVAPGDYHLKTNYTTNGCLSVNLTQEPPVSGHRPSVNAMMESVHQNFNGKIIGVIMTGMGSDGANGMKMIKEKGGITIAEDESTCVVFGMPKAAINAQCIDHVVPLNQIGPTIIKMLR